METQNLRKGSNLLLNKREVFSLINAANVGSPLMHENFVTSPETFSKFSDKAKGIPIMIPADEKLFHFGSSDVFTLSKNQILKTVFDMTNGSYIGFKHSFNQFKFLSNFEVKKPHKPYIDRVINQSAEVMAYVTSLKQKYKHVGAFQTRNIPHFGHEKIIQRLLEVCDHVVINPVVGPKKKGDVTIKCLTNIFTYLSQTKYKSKISFMPIIANMFYAGPREAMHHTLMRERIGFHQFTVGRDHAGAENAYDPQMASELVRQNMRQLKIEVMVHKGAAFCSDCNGVVLIGDCSHSIQKMVDISGSDFRSSIKEKNIFALADTKMQGYLLNSKMEIFEK